MPTPTAATPQEELLPGPRRRQRGAAAGASGGSPVRARLGAQVALVAVALLVVDAAVDLFGTQALVGWLTADRLLTLVGLVALLATGTRWRDLRTRLDPAVGLLVVAATATTALGGHDAAPLRGLLALVGVYYLVVGLLRRDPTAVRGVALVALAGVVAVGGTALAQVGDAAAPFGCRTPLFAQQECGGAALPRTLGTFANPNLMAAFLIALAPLAALVAVGGRRGAASSGGAGSSPRSGERLVAVALVVVAGLGMVTAFSRAAVLAAAVGGALALATSPAAGAVVRVARGHVVAAAAVAGVAVLGTGGLLAATLLGSDAAGGVDVRGHAWLPALAVAQEHWLLGVGLTRAGTVISASDGAPMTYLHAHDLWLNWLVETGVPGLVAVTALTVGALWLAWVGARRGDVVSRAALAGLAALLVMSLVDHPSANSRVAFALWLLLAVVAARAPSGWGRRGRPGSDPA